MRKWERAIIQMNSISLRAGKFQCSGAASPAAIVFMIMLSWSGQAKAIPIWIDLGMRVVGMQDRDYRAGRACLE